MKDTTATSRSASYFDLHLAIDNEGLYIKNATLLQTVLYRRETERRRSRVQIKSEIKINILEIIAVNFVVQAGVNLDLCFNKRDQSREHVTCKNCV